MERRNRVVRWLFMAVMAIGLSVIARYTTLALMAKPVPQEIETPVLRISPAQLDFGAVWEQERLTWPMDVENTTDRPQVVQSMSGSCACQVFEPRSFTLPPRGKQRVTVEVNLSQSEKNSEAAEVPFRVAMWASVVGQTQQIEWVLRGRVRQSIRVPQRLELGRVSELAPQKAALTFGVTTFTTLRQLQAKCYGEVANVSVVSVPAGNQTHFNVTVTPRSGVKAGDQEAILTLTPETPDGQLLPTKTVPVRFKVGPDILATPELIYTGHREPDDKHTETITLHSVSGRTLTVTKVEAIGPGLSVKPLPNPDGLTAFTVEQTIQPTGVETSAKFTVLLNSGETYGIVVPVISVVPSVPRPEVRP